jgi:hypothetical protein
MKPGRAGTMTHDYKRFVVPHRRLATGLPQLSAPLHLRGLGLRVLPGDGDDQNCKSGNFWLSWTTTLNRC